MPHDSSLAETMAHAHTDGGKPARMMVLATYASVGVALLLIVTKATAWLITDSVAILASLADSSMDMMASLVNMFAIHQALRPADANHRFGHGKAEPLSGLAQSAFITGSALVLVFEAVPRFFAPVPVNASEVGIVVMVFSIAATAGLVIFQRLVVRRTGSVAVSADMLHYSGDLLMNLSVIGALLLSSRLGWSWADPVFSIAIAAYLVWNAWQIASSSIDYLMDHELPDEDRAHIRQIVQSDPRVRAIHELRTRSSGLDRFIQMHVVLDRDLPLHEAHAIADLAERKLRDAFPRTDVLIHQDPYGLEEHHYRVGAPVEGGEEKG